MSDAKPPQQLKLNARRVSRSVYLIDFLANVGIRVGGLFVVFAVLGMVVFIVTQVTPLFSPPAQGIIDLPRAPKFENNTSFIHCDEYRRTVVRINGEGKASVISALTGDVISEGTLGPLKDAGLASLWGTTRSTAVISPSVNSSTTEHILLAGTRNGEVWQGKVRYSYDFMRVPLNPTDDDLAAREITREEWTEIGKLERPEEKDTKEPRYAPRVVIAGKGGNRAVVEHQPKDFQFYRKMRASVDLARQVEFPTEGSPVVDVCAAVEVLPDHEKPHEMLTGIVTGSGRVFIKVETMEVNAMSDEWEGGETAMMDLTRSISRGTPRFIRINGDRNVAVVVTHEGTLYTFERDREGNFNIAYPPADLFKDHDGKKWADAVAEQRAGRGYGRPEGTPRVTAVEYLFGDITLLIGDSLGGVQAWFQIKENKEAATGPFGRVRTHLPSEGAIVSFTSAQTHKSFLCTDQSGRVRALHNTAEREFFNEKVGAGEVRACSPLKEEGFIAVGGDGKLHHWWIDAPHPDVSLAVLIAPVWYEDYREPIHHWESTGPFEAEKKYGLVPLVVGTLKGGLYALLVAIPLALLGAVYTSEFMHRKLRSVVKPSMEIMASLPSVVLGFLAAMYFAPEAAPRMPTIIVALFFCPALFLLFGWLFQQLPPSITARFTPFLTTLTLVVVLFAGIGLSSLVGPRVEQILFPAVESADPALVDTRTFKPLTVDAERRLDTGAFRPWTSGGAELANETGLPDPDKPARILSAADGKPQPADIAVRLTKEVKARGVSGEVTIAAQTFLKLESGVFRDAETRRVYDLPEDTPALRGDTPVKLVDGEPRILPKGWWIPGGHTLFAFLMWMPFSLLAAWVLKLIFAGGHLIVWPVKRLIPRKLVDVPELLTSARAAMAGGKVTGLRPVAVNVATSIVGVAVMGGIGLGLTSVLSPVLEGLLFSHGHPTAGSVADFRRFVTGPEGWKFTQTNSLIVGFAMGFAVIPIIYSIAEDALSTVPNHLRAASLACGASRWQTTVRIVIPAAASGIFSAIVIGLGRAVGETMIVVMAAGGTPVMDMQPLVGFRSLSAAIATEIAEAPDPSTHRRALFLGGLVLFLMTFLMSTFAEFVRMRLRKKLNRM